MTIPRVAASLLAVASLFGAGRLAAAEPPAEAGRSSSSPLVRYQDRLAADATRILAPEVKGSMKSALTDGALDLATSLTITEWRTRLVKQAPALDKASRDLERRTEVLWSEEKVTDRYDSATLQLASVHAMTKGLSTVVDALGVRTAPLPTALPEAAHPTTPIPESAPAGTSAAAQPVAAPSRSAASEESTPSRAEAAAGAFSPAQIAAYGRALEQEAYRILSPEIGGRSLEGVIAARDTLRAATSVASWKVSIATASPALAKSSAVLERRAEVLRGSHGVLDTYESEAVQREGVRALQAGLERILREFGK